MSGYEEQLHARAEMLDETGELAAAATEILTFASGAGVDPRAVVSLRAPARAPRPAGARPPPRAPSSACGPPPGHSTRPAACPATRRAAWPTGTRAAGTGPTVSSS